MPALPGPLGNLAPQIPLQPVGGTLRPFAELPFDLGLEARADPWLPDESGPLEGLLVLESELPVAAPAWKVTWRKRLKIWPVPVQGQRHMRAVEGLLAQEAMGRSASPPLMYCAASAIGVAHFGCRLCRLGDWTRPGPSYATQ
jgi:hypothetical protein